MDWALLLAVVATAAGVSTAVATGVTFWLRSHERPEAEWVITGDARWPERSYAGEKYAEQPELSVTMVNAGDGTAYRVTVTALSCEAGMFRRTSKNPAAPPSQLAFVPIMTAGDAVSAWVHCSIEDWSTAELVLEWTPPPTRLRKRMTRRLPIREISELPPPADLVD